VRTSTGALRYTPQPTFYGTDQFTYKASDGKADSNAATVSILVERPNHAPLAVRDDARTNQDSAVTINVLTNDSDADSDPLTVASFTQGEQGSVVRTSTGALRYTPQPGFFGTDQFTYKASDGKADSNTATVSIVVERPNSAPLAVRDQASTDEDAAVTVNVLSNDSDPDGDPLALVSFTQGAHGSVASVGGGALRYTPQPNFDQADRFTYTVGDGRGGTAVGTVEITVNPVNDPPVARADSLSTAEDAAGTVNVVANDSDPENDAIVVTAYTQGEHGSVDMPAGDGRTVSYTPAAGFRGVDSFNYTVSDGHGGVATAAVSVSVGGTLYDEDFDDGSLAAPSVQLGGWRIIDDPSADHPGDRCYLASAPSGSNAIVAQAFAGAALMNLDIQATFNADNLVPGQRWSNAFVIFDYHSPTDFKFAGAFVGIDRWVIGRSAWNADGYVVDRVFSERIDPYTDYAVQVLVENNTVTLGVYNGQRYVPKVIQTYSGPAGSLQDGSAGVGTMRGTARFDDLQVKATDRVFAEAASGA